MSTFDEHSHPHGADGHWTAMAAGQPAAALNGPRSGSELTSRNDAVEAISPIVSECDSTLDGRDPDEVYDLDAVTDDVLTRRGSDSRCQYVLPDEADRFWSSMARHER